MLTYLVINSGALLSLYDHKILILNDLVSWPVLCFEIAMMLDKSMHCRVTVVQQSEFSVRRDSWIRYSYQEMDPDWCRDDREGEGSMLKRLVMTGWLALAALLASPSWAEELVHRSMSCRQRRQWWLP